MKTFWIIAVNLPLLPYFLQPSFTQVFFLCAASEQCPPTVQRSSAWFDWSRRMMGPRPRFLWLYEYNHPSLFAQVMFKDPSHPRKAKSANNWPPFFHSFCVLLCFAETMWWELLLSVLLWASCSMPPNTCSICVTILVRLFVEWTELFGFSLGRPSEFAKPRCANLRKTRPVCTSKCCEFKIE